VAPASAYADNLVHTVPGGVEYNSIPLVTANTLFPTSIFASITRGLSPNSPFRMIFIFPGNGLVALPANNFPDLTHILSAYRVVEALFSSNISAPKTVKFTSLGGSTSKMTL
jgi:hypothetical protein